MQQIPINWLAVILAALIRMVVGTIWYSPVAFVKPWQAMTGVTEQSMRAGLAKAVGVDAVLSLVMAFILLHAVTYAGANSWWTGGLVGALNWLGFIFTTFFALWAYENRPLKLIAINTGHNLVALILMGALLAVWR